MNRTQTFIQFVCATVLGSSALAADVIYDFTPNTAILDGNASGIADSRSFLSGLANLTDVNLSLNIAGNYSGDLFGYLNHGSGYSVLLNRPGRNTGVPYGYAGGGLSIRLDDAAGSDIHTYGGGAASGDYQPDARTADPASVLTGSARSAYLSSFNGGSGDGTWTLFMADLAPGFSHTLTSWSLEMSATPTGGETRIGPGYGYRVQTDGALAGNLLNVLSGGKATFNAANATIGSLSGAGKVVVNGTTLTAGTDNSSTIFSGSLLGVGSLVKQGSGMMTLSGNSTNGGITISNGKLVLNGIANAPVVVQTGATLGGIGTVIGNLTVNAGGTHAPGSSAGIQHIIGNYANNGTLAIELNGTTAGSGHDQVDVQGSVTLGNAILDLSLGFTPQIADTFLIINNDLSDSVIGNFLNLLEGEYVSVGIYTFQISYIGGDGNDVTLYTTEVPEASTWALMVLGGFGMLMVTRRWKKI